MIEKCVKDMTLYFIFKFTMLVKEINMVNFIKYTTIFFLLGIIWFGIFSIPVSNKTTLFAAIQKELILSSNEVDNNSNKKEIDRQKVIDAISRAFDN